MGDDGAVAMGTVAALDLLSSSGSSEQCISSKSYVDEVGSGQCVYLLGSRSSEHVDEVGEH